MPTAPTALGPSAWGRHRGGARLGTTPGHSRTPTHDATTGTTPSSTNAGRSAAPSGAVSRTAAVRMRASARARAAARTSSATLGSRSDSAAPECCERANGAGQRREPVDAGDLAPHGTGIGAEPQRRDGGQQHLAGRGTDRARRRLDRDLRRRPGGEAGRDEVDGERRLAREALRPATLLLALQPWHEQAYADGERGAEQRRR